MKFINRFLLSLSLPWRIVFIVMVGILAGGGLYALYLSRAVSYLSDDPKTCINCHVMNSYYASWFHSSHSKEAGCNDCHVPHDNVFSKYAFKAMDGLYHSYVFTMRTEPIAIRAREASSKVIMQNCVRCHNTLNTAMVSIGHTCLSEAKKDQGKACWDCHANIAHGRISNTASAPNAIVPLPASPVPAWLKKAKK